MENEELRAINIIKNWKADSKLREEFGNNLSVYAAYMEAVKEGRVQIAGRKP